MLTCVSLQLFGWNYDLHTCRVTRVWDWVVQNANCSNYLPFWNKSVLGGIARVANHNWSTGCLVSASYSTNFSTSVESDFVNLGVQHVGSSMDSAKSTECLGQSTKTIDWVQEATGSVLAVTLKIKLHLFDRVDSWLVKISIRILQCNCVTQEIDSVFVKVVVLENVLHGCLMDVEVVPSLRVIEVDLADELVQIDQSLFFEHAHQAGLNSFGVVSWHFAHRHACVRKVTCCLVLAHVTSSHALPLQVLCHLSDQQHFDEFSIGHNEFGDHVYIPISVVAQVFWWILVGSELLPEVGQVKRSSLTSIVFVSVQMKHLFALDCKQT